MANNNRLSYEKIYEIDKASFKDEADFYKVVTALQDIENTDAGQELFRDLQKTAHLQEGRRIKIECNFDDPRFAEGTPAFAKTSTGKIWVNPETMREDGMMKTGLGYPAQLDSDPDFEPAPFTFSQILVHESDHLARIPPGTNADIASEEGLKNTACFESLAIERTNRYRAEKNQPKRERYMDSVMEVEIFKKTVADIEQIPGEFLRDAVARIESLNAGCHQLSEDELNSRVSHTLNRMFDKANQHQR